jgi:hypothetical protein
MGVAHALTFALQTIAHRMGSTKEKYLHGRQTHGPFKLKRVGSIVGPSGLTWACAQVHVRPEAIQKHPSAQAAFRGHPSHGHEHTSQRNGCGQGF